MSSLKTLADLVVTFRDQRNWKQFHNPKDQALSLLLEASELVEHFQWKNGDDITDHIEAHREEISDELADVLYWVLLMSHDLDIDLESSFQRKLKKNEEKYPVEKSYGKSTKYDEL